MNEPNGLFWDVTDDLTSDFDEKISNIFIIIASTFLKISFLVNKNTYYSSIVYLL